MKKKRIMILGANDGQVKVIEKALHLGYYVITADIHKDAPGHTISDEQLYIDITNKDIVLQEALRLHIDGITPYWSDILAPVSTFVAEQMNIPGNSIRTIELMTHTQLFRQFLADNGFPAPKAKGCRTIEEAIAFFNSIDTPAIMKPVDSSGSKGVFKICTKENIMEYFNESMKYSIQGIVILEEFIETDLPQQDGDIFVIDGRVSLWGICEQHKDTCLAPYTPASLILPSSIDRETDEKARRLIQELITALNYRIGPCNVEYIVSRDGRIFILDIGPRNGGNMIPQVIHHALGYDITSMTLQAAVGDNITIKEEPHELYAASIIVHTDREGVYHGITIDKHLQQHFCDSIYLKKKGESVSRFRSGKDTIACLVFSFSNKEEMDMALDPEHIKVYVSEV